MRGNKSKIPSFQALDSPSNVQHWNAQIPTTASALNAQEQQQQTGGAERVSGWFLRLPAGEEAGRALQLCSPDCCECSLELQSFSCPTPAGETPREATGALAQPEQPQPGTFPLQPPVPSGRKGSLRGHPQGGTPRTGEPQSCSSRDSYIKS